MSAKKLLVLAFGLNLAACATANASVGTAPGDASADSAFESYRAAYESNDAATYRQARDQHASWLAKNSGAAGEREVRVRYGKLLYALGENERAAAELSKVAHQASDFLGRGAARNAIVVLHEARLQDGPALKLLRDRGRLDRVTLDLHVGAIELPDYSSGQVAESAIEAPELALKNACDVYAELADDQDTALPLFYLMSAEISLRHGHAVEGVERCAALVARWPQTENAESCVLVSIDALNQRQDWNQLEHYARIFRGNLSLIGADHLLEQQLEQVVQVATFNRIQAAAESNKRRDPAMEKRALIRGAEEFRAFQREFPYSENADEALFNAFVYFERAEKRAEAISAGQILLAMYSASPLSQRLCSPPIRAAFAPSGACR